MSHPVTANPPSLWGLRRLGLRARFLALFYLVSLGSAALVGWYGYRSADMAQREKAQELVQGSAGELSLKIAGFLDLAHKDLAFISGNYALQRRSYWMDIGDESKREQYHQILSDILRGFSANYDYTYLIHIVNSDGHEHIVIQRDPQSGAVTILPEDELLDQSERDWFARAKELPTGAIYTSELDFARRSGRIEQPRIPVLRLSTPLVGGNQVRYGVVATTLFADHLYQFIREVNRIGQGRRFFLVNDEGRFLYYPDETKSLAHLLGQGGGLETEHPGLLERLRKEAAGRGTFTAGGEIVAFEALRPDPANPNRRWYLVGMVPEALALAELKEFAYTFAVLVAVVILLVLAATRYFLAGLMGPLGFVTRQMQRLGRGEATPEFMDYPADDEVHAMLDSTQALMTNMERLALSAEAIGRGDFSQEVILLSEQDRLGGALKRMTLQLREARSEEARRNWLADGLGQLSAALTGDLNPQQMAATAIALLGRYLGAGRGVCYRYDPDTQCLDLLGSYMFSERPHAGNRFRLGEGAVGQVGRERKPIALVTVEEEGAPIVTGTHRVHPLYTYTWPLLREDELLGVMELASCERFDSLKVQFLETAAERIAAFLYMAGQRENIQRLLRVAEASERAAREQSERLREANALMEEQQQQLQQQTEALQRSNTQMEEQQQQLQQQTEELQQTNAQMEEQQQQLQQQTEELRQTNAQMEAQRHQLEQRNAELTRSQQELDNKAQQLEQASRYKSEFLANMSHELRTPLNSVILLSKMLANNESGRLAEEEVKQAEVIHRSGQELLRLINDVLDLSKIEAGRMELHLVPVESGAFLAEFRDLFEPAAREKGLSLRVEDRLQGQFVSDRAKLAQVVRNLLANAIKFTKTGSITLSLERQPGARLPIRIAVRDTGIGIQADKRELIFEAFQQADGSTSREYGGTGLGLSISLRFAQLLGGTIELESAPGAGSLFTVALPESPPAAGIQAAPPVAAVPAPAAERVKALSTQDSALGTPLPPLSPLEPAAPTDDRERIKVGDRVILLIDDDRAFGQAVVAINHRLGYKTLLAERGTEGLELARRHRPAGILLDLGLPDLDGAEVLHRLKQDPALAAIPVYVVSAQDRDAAVLEDGIVGYLQKPVDDRQIATAEAAVLAALGAGEGGILVVENGGISAAEVGTLLGSDSGPVRAASPAALAAALTQGPWRIVLIDLDAHPLEQGLAIAREVRAALPQTALLFFADRPLGEEEEARLRHYSDSIVLKTPQSERRLLENIERFLREAPRGQAPVETSAPAAARRLEGRHILVVDDDARNLFVITAALERHGAQVSTAINGKRALERLAQGTVDLVIMDVMMPEMDGYQAIAKLRADPALAGIPILALTAKALPDDREKILAAGADDYLAKPVDYEVLVNLAGVWCEGRKKAR